MNQPAKKLISFNKRRKYEDVMATPTDTLFRYLPNNERFDIIIDNVRYGPYEKLNYCSAISCSGKMWHNIHHNMIVWHVETKKPIKAVRC